MPRSPDLVRRAALVLSSDRPLLELYDELAVLLAVFVDASMMLIFTGDRDELTCAYVNVQGRSGAPDDGRVSPESTSAAVYASGQAVRYDSIADWPMQRLYAINGRTGRPQAAIFTPIYFGGERVGVLSVQSFREGAYTDEDVSTLETCALYLGARIHDERQRKAVERYERLATIDVLTGIPNRSAMDAALEREWRRARRNGEPIAMLMLDVDFFKTFNDTYGHVAGDSCLQQVAAAGAGVLVRPSDLFARYGGEEFAAILPQTTLEGAVQIGETLRKAVERLAIPHEGSSLGHVTVSVGAAAIEPQAAAEGAEALVLAADEALYDAKRGGRNRVCAPGFRGGDATPAERRVRTAGNVPTLRTKFFGRQEDVARVNAAIEQHRLVTIAGTGGVGKTRVAVEVAREASPRYPDGAWFVDLLELGDETDIASLVSTALKGIAPPRRDIENLIGALRERQLLLVLDNCEHIVEAVAIFVDDLLAALPGVSVLATSREPLASEGEHVVRLRSLSVADGAALFLDRAASAGVATDSLSLATVGQIVEQLDGIPLAIEIAAPRLAILPLEELRERLNDRLNLLRTSSRRHPSRQQTLRALLDWSYRLLSAREQRVFRRLAVFVGTWTIPAAVTICGGDDLSPSAVEDAIESLIAKSLVQSGTGENDEPRFSLLETTREYAAEQLGRAGDGAVARRLHARAFAQIAIELGAQRRRIPTTPWQRRVTAERGDLLAALNELIDQGDYDTVARCIEGLADWFWERGGIYAADARAPLQATLERHPEMSPSQRAALHLALASLQRVRDPGATWHEGRQAYTYYADVGPPRMEAAALRCVAIGSMLTSGGVDRALQTRLENLGAEMEAAGELSMAAELMNLLGTLHTQSMDDALLPRARECFERAIELYERRGDGDRCGIMNGNCSDVAFYMGDVTGAIELARRAVVLLEQSEEPWFLALEYLNLGHFSAESGDFTTSRAALRKALRGLEAFGGRYGTATVYDKFAHLAFALGAYDRAARMLGVADELFTLGGAVRQHRERALIDALRVKLQELLGVTGYAQACEAGRNFSSEQAEAEADAI